MDSSLLADTIDRNLADAIRHIARHGGGTLDQTSSRVLAAGRHPYRGPLLNAAIRTDRRANPEAVVADALRFFGKHGHAFVIWAAADADADLAEAALSAGLSELHDAGAGSAMALSVLPAASDLPSNAAFSVVSNREDARDFALVAGQAFATAGQPPEVAQAMFADNDVLLAPDAVGILLYIAGEPVSCALLLETVGSSGIYFVGTIEPARGQGLGEAVTRQAALTAFRHGAGRVVLSAADRAVSMYERVGFVPISRYGLYGTVGRLPARAASSVEAG